MKNYIEEKDYRLVRSSHPGNDVYYRVSKGLVKWRDQLEPQLVITILMQYGDTLEWCTAVRNGEIYADGAAQVPLGDCPSVIKAIMELSL